MRISGQFDSKTAIFQKLADNLIFEILDRNPATSIQKRDDMIIQIGVQIDQCRRLVDDLVGFKHGRETI